MGEHIAYGLATLPRRPPALVMASHTPCVARCRPPPLTVVGWQRFRGPPHSGYTLNPPRLGRCIPQPLGMTIRSANTCKHSASPRANRAYALVNWLAFPTNESGAAPPALRT